MTKRHLVLFFAILLLTACELDSGDTSPIVARVGHRVITADTFMRDYESGFGHLKKGENRKLAYLQYMIKERLLALEGYRIGLDNQDWIQQEEKKLYQELLIDALITQEIRSHITVSFDEIKEEINKSKASFKFRFWAERDFNKARDIVIDMRERGFGEVSGDLIRRNPESTIKPTDLETEFLTHLEVRPEILAAIKDLPRGAISDAVKIDDQYYIFQVTDLRRKGVTEGEYREKSNAFQQVIYYRKLQQEIQKYVSGLLDAEEITTSGESLKHLTNALMTWKRMEKTERLPFRLAIQEADDQYPHFLALRDHLQAPFFTAKSRSMTVEEFLVHFNPGNIDPEYQDRYEFLRAVNNAVMFTIRDNFLSEKARALGLEQASAFRQQAERWRDKWVYEASRNHFKGLYRESATGTDSLAHERRYLDDVIMQLQETYPVYINHAVLDTITVTDFKKSRWASVQIFRGGTNRPAYPHADPSWGL